MTITSWWQYNKIPKFKSANIPILPIAFLTFAEAKSLVDPSPGAKESELETLDWNICTNCADTRELETCPNLNPPPLLERPKVEVAFNMEYYESITFHIFNYVDTFDIVDNFDSIDSIDSINLSKVINIHKKRLDGYVWHYRATHLTYKWPQGSQCVDRNKFFGQELMVLLQNSNLRAHPKGAFRIYD